MDKNKKMRPFISVCIATYKRVKYLPKLLDSLVEQRFKDFNVVITDNSEDDVVEQVVNRYKQVLPILYHRNVPALNMAGNWNAGIKMADGEWIKPIHDDDWFLTPDSLGEFASVAKTTNAKFVFSGYNSVHEQDGRVTMKTISQQLFSKTCKNPFLLLADNVIGNPSVFMFHRSVNELYETFMTWYVDIEFYMKTLTPGNAVYIDKPLIGMGYNETQVTNFTATNPVVVVPEALFIMKKYGNKRARNIIVYDAWWRLMRNVGIRSASGLHEYAGGYPIPAFLDNIVSHQQLIPKQLLKLGLLSKTAMMISYCINYKHLAD